MKKTNRILASLLAGAWLLGAGAVPALGAEEPLSKEEVVYINLSPAGDVDSVDVVNIFDLPQPGRIVDHGAYASVRNMTGTEPITMDGQTVTIDAGTGRLYYEGSLPEAEIPWQISLHYLMDGQEYAAEDIAGMSGALEIRMSVKENPRCTGDFFQSYALQISLTLDGDRCQNITAEGATVANVGSDKQLNFTVLPGKGADISVTAQVTDFAMDAAAINGVPLALDVEVDDEALLGQVTELTDAISALDVGAGSLSEGVASLAGGADSALAGAGALCSGAAGLRSGASSLQSGGSSVQSGAYDVSTGAAALDEGVQTLNDGMTELGSGLEQLNSQSPSLVDGSAKVLSALQTIQSGLDGVQLTQEDIDALNGALASAQTSLGSLSADLTSAVTAVGTLAAVRAAYGALADRLDAAIAGLAAVPDPSLPPEAPAPTIDTSALTAVAADLRANNDQFDAVLGQLASLSDTANTLQTDLGAISTGVSALSALVSGLPGALTAAQTGIDTLTADYATLDAGIGAYTQGVAEVYAGYAQLAGGVSSLAEGSAALAEGAGTLYGGTTALLGGITDLYNATGTLTDGAGALDSGIAELQAGIAQLDEGAGDMKQGTQTLAEGTDGMDEAIQEKIDQMLSSVTGQQGQPASFVSERNTNVSAVQFVIRTPAIEKPAPPEPSPAPEQTPTFWEKLIALF